MSIIDTTINVNSLTSWKSVIVEYDSGRGSVYLDYYLDLPLNLSSSDIEVFHAKIPCLKFSE
ncbi:MAG: hypothetical protein LBS93_04675 [Synergistaceae bacterium]|jgi:hypothetical protein|nr:hypothetical protein [Synergistaceae bacterium]